VWKKSSLAVLLLCQLTPLAAAQQRYQAAEPHMGTLVKITLAVPNEAISQQAFRAAFDRIAELDRKLSNYNKNSELSRLRPGPPTPVTDDLFTLLKNALRIAERTHFAYDITAGPLTQLWRQRQLPTPEALARARQATGSQHLILRKGKIQLTRPGMQLDPGGIAKGYAAEEALKVLYKMGIRQALVAVSGDLALGDPPPNQEGWRIEAQGRILTLSNCSVSTSGSSEQFWIAPNGKRYSHIIDPRTGYPLETTTSVTVVHKHGAWADALATALTIQNHPIPIVCYTKACKKALATSTPAAAPPQPSDPPSSPSQSPPAR
jgi:thiamine biosynthesis lipoprotein